MALLLVYMLLAILKKIFILYKMADIQSLGANTDTRYQSQNLWASLNKLTNYVNANSCGSGGTGTVI